MTGASALRHGDQAAATRTSPLLMLGGHVAALPERTLAEEACDFVAAARGCTRSSICSRRFKAVGDPDSRKVRGLVYRRTAGRCAQRRRAARARPRRRDARHRLGPAADGAVPRAQLALPRRSRARSRTRPSTRRSAARTTARSAASRRRSRAASRRWASSSDVEQLSLLEPDARRRADRPARQRATASGTSRSPTRCSCSTSGTSSASATAHRARLRPQHLGLRARRHGQGRHARQAEARRVQLAGVRHRGGGRARADRRGQAVPGRRGLRHGPHASRPPASTSSATTSSACPRTTARRCRRRSTWRWTSTASSPTSTRRWPIPARRCTSRRCAEAGALPETWTGYSQHAVDTLPLPTRHLSAGEVLRFRDQAFHDVLHARALSGDGREKVRRGHGRAHPRDDVAPAGEEIRETALTGLCHRCRRPRYR